MRIGLLVSLVVHGAAAAGLALLGISRVHEEPEHALSVGIRADAAPEPEPPPPCVPAPPEPPRAPERWEFPEEAPEIPEIVAPDEPAPAGVGGTRAIRLARPLARPRKARPAPAPPKPPAVAVRIARTGELHPPRLLADLSPAARYPERARRQGLEGTVVLLLNVGKDGVVIKVAVETSSGHEELDGTAADAAALWRFEPARRDGEAIPFEVRVPVEFRLTDA